MIFGLFKTMYFFILHFEVRNLGFIIFILTLGKMSHPVVFYLVIEVMGDSSSYGYALRGYPGLIGFRLTHRYSFVQQCVIQTRVTHKGNQG